MRLQKIKLKNELDSWGPESRRAAKMLSLVGEACCCKGVIDQEDVERLLRQRNAVASTPFIEGRDKRRILELGDLLGEVDHRIDFQAFLPGKAN